MAALLASAGPATATPTINETVEVTDISSIAVSPDGRQVAFRTEKASVARNAYDLAWYVVPSDGSAPPRRVAGAGEGDWRDGMLAPEPPIWTADSHAILYRAVANGQVQVWRADAAGSGARQLTDDPANIRGFAITPGGDAIVYATGASRAAIERAETNEYDSGVLIDARVDPARQLYRGALIDGRLTSDRLSGAWFTFGDMLAGTPNSFRALDLTTMRLRDATRAEQGQVASPAKPMDQVEGRGILAEARSGDSRGTAYSLIDGQSAIIAIVRPGQATPTFCRSPLCHQLIRGLAWQGHSENLLFAASDGATNQTLYLWTPATGGVRRISGGDGRLEGGRDGRRGCAIDAAAVYCVAASANRPPRLVRIGISSGATTTLAAPNDNLVREDQLRFEPLTWKDQSGQPFAGQLMRPPQGSPSAPLFVTYYVCDGYLRGGTGDEFPLRQLAASGIAVLCINRAATGAGLDDQVGQYRLAESGVGAAVALLARNGIVDPHRVGMGGVSFGGESAMWIAQHSRILSAVSVGNTLLSRTYYWFNAMPGREVPMMLKQVWKVGSPDVDRDRWKMLSPELAIENLHTPLLMQLPEREFRYNVELAARLGQVSKPVELWAFPGETHLKYQPRHKVAIYQRNLDWFRFWLQGYVDPDPAKAAQYQRWRAMAGAGSAAEETTLRTQRSVSAIGSR